MFSDDPLYRKGRLKRKTPRGDYPCGVWWNKSIVDMFADNLQVRP